MNYRTIATDYDFDSAAARGQAEIPGSDVGAIVMHHLRELDDIAYIRFASVYRRFEDVDSLLAEAQDVKATARTSDPSVSLELPLKLD